MRLLFAEDDRDLSAAVKTLLERNGYLVDAVYDGEEAVKMARDASIDLILLDVMLPKTDGLTACRTIRTFSDVPIIMLTAKGELEDKLIGFGEGANDYVPKPFHIDELVARINAQLRVASVKKEELTYGNTLLDYKTPAVCNKDTGESIKINNKEFQLLEYFMMNHSQVLSKEMIYDRVWGMENDSLSNNLEAYMSFVRKKLKMIDSNVTIKSVRNMGYRMEIVDEGIK